MTTKIVICGCKTGTGSEYQDATYGKGQRVANINTKPVAHCTCCGKEHK